MKCAEPGTVEHDGQEPCGARGCDPDARWCVWAGDSPSSPHACLCVRDPGHGYYCYVHQLAHASSHGKRLASVFPDCGARAAEVTTESTIALRATSDPDAPGNVDRELWNVLAESICNFLNFCDPGTIALERALEKLRTNPRSAVRPEEIATATERWGENRRPYLQFTPAFLSGGTLDKIGRVALEHLFLAVDAGYDGPVQDVLAEERKHGRGPSDEAIEAYVTQTLHGMTRVRQRVEVLPQERERLFALLYEMRDAAPDVTSWFRQVAASSVPTIEQFADSLVLDYEPTGVLA